MVNPRKYHVLGMLADAGKRGRADDAFVSRFTCELLDLVSEQLAMAEREVKIVRGSPLEFARLRITDEGRQTLKQRIVHCERPAAAVAA
jgi:hypothetical protein